MKTRERIMQTALQLFNETGSGAISTNHIAEALGISPGNLYYHFHNKEEIIRAILDHLISKREEGVQLPDKSPLTVKDLQQLVEENFRLRWDYRFFYRDLFALTQRDPVLKEHYLAVLQQGFPRFEVFVERFVEAGLVILPPDHTTISDIATICLLVSDHWLQFVEIEGNLSLPEYMRQGVRLVLQVIHPYLSETAQTELNTILHTL